MPKIEKLELPLLVSPVIFMNLMNRRWEEEHKKQELKSLASEFKDISEDLKPRSDKI